MLDREVTFTLIRAQGLDEVSRTRIIEDHSPFRYCAQGGQRDWYSQGVADR